MKFSLQPTMEVHTTQNIVLRSFRRRKADKTNGNDLKTASPVRTSWYINTDVGVDCGGESGEGGGERGERNVHCALLGDGMVGKTCLTLRYTQHLFTDRYTATVFDNYPVPVSIKGEKYVVDLCDTAGQSDYEGLRTSTYESSEVLVLCFSVCDRESFYSVLQCWLPEIQRHTKGKRPLLLVGTQIDLRSSSPSSSNLNASKSSSSEHKSSSSSSSDLKASKSSSSESKASNSSSSNRTTTNSSSDLKTPNSSSLDLLNSNSPSSKSSSSDVKTSNSSSSSSPASSCLDEVSTEEGSQLAKIIGADCYIECSARSEEGVQQVFEHVVFSALKYRKKKNKLLSRLFSW